MLKFKLLLWMFTQLLRRQVRKNSACARYIADQDLVFQIRTEQGAGRYFVVRNGAIRSRAGLTEAARFTLSFKDAHQGFTTLSAKDSQAAFLRALGRQDLVIRGDFLAVSWFQGLTAFLQPPKTIAPLDRSPFDRDGAGTC